MPIEIKLNGFAVPAIMLGRLSAILAQDAAPVIGQYLVRQIEHTHDVQGRDEEEHEGIWPPRKLPSSGLVVWGNRKDIKDAIKRLDYEKRMKAAGKVFGEEITSFSIAPGKKSIRTNAEIANRKRIWSAKGALNAEKARKAFQKKLKAELGENSTRKMQNARRVLNKELTIALGEGNVEDAARARQSLYWLNRAIAKPGSWARTATYSPRPVLFRTGTLKSSWTFRVERRGPMVTLFVGTPVAYAKQHEFGTPRIPARRQFVISRKDRENIQKLTADVLSTRFREQSNG